jgi:C-terminal processing protease CtpA/Prc
VGYIRVATFNSSTTAAVQDAITQLQQQGVGALVLDIRWGAGWG